MKIILVILFAVALALHQPQAASVPCPPQKACCACGGDKNCCVNPAGKSGRETPAVPAAGLSQKGIQVSGWFMVSFIGPVAAPASRTPAFSDSAHFARGVPLFRQALRRDCAFLL